MKIEEILQIDYLSLLDKLWIEHKKAWFNEHRLQGADWWSLNIEKNFITDFSNDRPQWNQFVFVREYKKLDDKETFEWFKENFSYWTNKKMETKTFNRQQLKKDWQALPDLNENQINYLKERHIQYNEIKWICKSFNCWIWCLVYDSEWPIGLTARLINSNQRFTAKAGYPTDWIYLNKIDKEKDYIIVVEWLIDFLTVRQYDTNVVWLKNWKNWIELIKELSKKFKIILIPDWDEQGEKTLETIWNSFEYEIVDIKQYWYKDINELVVQENVWPEIIDMIWNIKQDKSQWSIQQAFAQMDWYKERLETNWMLWYKTPYTNIDKFTQGFIPWKVYTIWASSNVWKSKFAYSYVNHFLQQWKSVIFFSLEVDKGMVIMNLLSQKEQLPLWDTLKLKNITWFEKLKIYDDVYNLEEMQQIVESQKPDIVVIDFVQNIQTKSSSNYERYSKIAVWIQQTAIKSKSCIISLSQLANDVGRDVSKWNMDFVSLKWAGEFVASSDCIFVLRRLAEWQWLQLKISKNKYWPAWLTFEVQANMEFWLFNVLEADLYY